MGSEIKQLVRKLWYFFRVTGNGEKSRLWLYPSWWKAHLSNAGISPIDPNQYFTAVPNRGAGIGHQISNWHAGLWYSMLFGVRHAHIPFSQRSWDAFLGYGDGDPTVRELKSDGYRIVRLPMFDEDNMSEVDLIRKIMSSYNGRKAVFCAEQDQHYKAQTGVIPYVRGRFHACPARKSDLTPYSKDNLNIAVHLRRGDIVIGQSNGDPNLTMRWLANEYYDRVLSGVLSSISTDKPVHIYVFSQGKEEDYPEFEKYDNVHFFLDLNPESTFLSFVYADILITSKSSFSYKPALLNKNGIKVCPRNFWHGYPDADDWVLAEDDGSILPGEVEKLRRI